ncbi:hypothetical protein [Novosphingobium humi]|uniref:hypothetical protein n=1 Tax=Novosphingobium humi TaxID=2282397 RepID=UPI0025B171E0|nr:hypothetical protein [Novosphingobium humi]WJS97814.1 hypothetical protein NYQ05_11790 [Novosphingobium humi]
MTDDQNTWMRCVEVKIEADRRRQFSISREAAFRAAAEALEYSTRYAARDEARLAGKKGSKIWKGDLSPSGLRVMEAILDFGDRPFDTSLLARYCDQDEKWISTAVRRLRSAGLISPVGFAVRWERFGLDHYDEWLEARIYNYDSYTTSSGERLTRWLPGPDTWIVLLRLAAFGGPQLTPDNFLLICGVNRDTWGALRWLQWVGLVHDGTLEVDLKGLLRFESFMKS